MRSDDDIPPGMWGTPREVSRLELHSTILGSRLPRFRDRVAKTLGLIWLWVKRLSLFRYWTDL